MTGSTADGVYLELYVRSLAPRGLQPRLRAVIHQVSELTAEGIIDGYEIYVCGHRVPASVDETTTEFGTFLLDRIDVFSDWATENGWSLDRTFERHHVESTLTGETIDVFSLPVVALAEYEGSDLCFVAPVCTEDSQWTVQDRLDTIKAEQLADSAERLADARTPSPESPALVH
jgi:hypothetical protein